MESEDRHRNERPLGTPISDALLALHAGGGGTAAVLCDAHANLRAMAREAEFLRRRHWADLPPDGPAWCNGAVLGYVGQCMPLLQLAALATGPLGDWAAVAYARSLWRQAWVSVRDAADAQADKNPRSTSLSAAPPAPASRAIVDHRFAAAYRLSLAEATATVPVPAR
ncbi:hypothetical protein [Pseudorhodoferax sp. Leaf274]|uniref:hypothetical protein n=1 Tax=Pseudorhodoferax sp. Leaf274 TaxID=1736318 RepID=UPI0012E2EEF2|nr:hypothetical protein [Pseudorhodoferax sp. Leaf274]